MLVWATGYSENSL